MKNFSSVRKFYYAMIDVRRQRGSEAGVWMKSINFFPIRASTNFCSSMKSKKIFLFPTELHAEILLFEKLHNLINNWKLLQDQDRILTFFCKLSHAERDLGKAQFLWIKTTDYSAFLLISIFDEIFEKNSSFRWLLLTDSGVLEEIFVKNVWKYQWKLLFCSKILPTSTSKTKTE